MAREVWKIWHGWWGECRGKSRQETTGRPLGCEQVYLSWKAWDNIMEYLVGWDGSLRSGVINGVW